MEQSGSQIPDTWSLKLIFSLIVTLYLAKTEKRTKRSLTQLSHYYFEKRYNFFPKKHRCFAKNADISKIKKALALKLHMRMYFSAKFKVSSTLLTIFRQEE